MHVWDLDEIKSLEGIFSDNLIELNHELEFIIPMKYLNSANPHQNQAINLNDSSYGEIFIEEMRKALNLSYSVHFSNFLVNIDKYMSIHRC